MRWHAGQFISAASEGGRCHVHRPAMNTALHLGQTVGSEGFRVETYGSSLWRTARWWSGASSRGNAITRPFAGFMSSFPPAPHGVLELPGRNVEGVRDRHVRVLAGLMGGDDLVAGDVKVDVHLEEISLVLVLVGFDHHHVATGNAGVQLVQAGRELRDPRIHRLRVRHAAVGDLGLGHTFKTGRGIVLLCAPLSHADHEFDERHTPGVTHAPRNMWARLKERKGRW